MAEKEYLKQGNIVITNSRAVLGGKTYSMANVTSVAIGEQSGRGCGFLLIAFGIIAVLLALAGGGFMPGGTAGGLLVALILLGVGIWITLSKSYTVRIGSASGESDGMTSRNRGEIEQIVEAMNQAIIERG